MKLTLKIGISGIRGIPGENLTPEIVISLSRCFAEFLGGGNILVAYDTRKSSKSLKYQVFSGLMLGKAKIIDLGIVPTPTLQIMTKELFASGAIMITASHNPLPWNGLKFINRQGMFLNEMQFQGFLNFFLSRSNTYKSGYFGEIKNIGIFNDAIRIHIDKILKEIAVNQIRKKQFKVAFDGCNGAGAKAGYALLESLNCEIFPLFTEQNRDFQRNPEPTANNLNKLKKMVLEKKVDIGFALDPDADRLAIVCENGEIPGEEYTLALATDFLLSKKRGPVATNLSTSRLIDDLAKKYHVPVFRTKVGEINVSETALRKKAVIAGEGNGGVIWPKIGFGRDSLSGMALILNYLAEQDKKISAIIKKLPKYYMVKNKYECFSMEIIHSIIEKLSEIYSGKKVNTLDGLKIEDKNWWLHIRSSNTEPIIRIISEAKTPQMAKTINNEALRKIINLEKFLKSSAKH